MSRAVVTRDIDLVLSDVDGTIVTNDKVLTGDAKAAVRALRDAGIAFALASSRPPRGMTRLIEPLSPLSGIACVNGGVFVHSDLTIIETHLIDPATARLTHDSMREEGLDVWVYTPDDWLVLDKNAPYVARETFTLGFEPRVVPAITPDHLAHSLKIVGVSKDFAAVAAAEAKARTLLGDKASAARSQAQFLDVTHPRANKGDVVLTFSKWLNIPTARIATIGDGSNDSLMFAQSGFSVAMGNGSEEVRRSATKVTDTNEDEGFAKAIRRFILGGER